MCSLSTIIDPLHPYYLHPSDNPGINLTTITLSENNYSQWSTSMEFALSAKLKQGFIDGSYTKPAVNSSLLLNWNRCNHMVISWMLNVVSNDIKNSIVYMNSTQDIWDDLEVRYTQSNMPKLFHLRKELSQLSQGSLSVTFLFYQI